MRRALTVAIVLLSATAAGAETLDLQKLLPEGGTAVSGRIIQLVLLLTVLSVAPGLLIMVTSFTRFVVAFSFLRSGIGLQTTPANLVLISLSLFMTFYVMAPTFDRAWDSGVQPLMDNQIGEQEALRASPSRSATSCWARCAKRTCGCSRTSPRRASAARSDATVDLRILIPAFMISELRRGFEIGFLIACRSSSST